MPSSLKSPKLKDIHRFCEKILVDPDQEHWYWTARLTDDGYGQFKFDRKCWRAHIWAYRVWIGDYDNSELELDHLCRVTDCVNPWHLEPVTPSVNKQRKQSSRSEYAEGR